MSHHYGDAPYCRNMNKIAIRLPYGKWHTGEIAGKRNIQNSLCVWQNSNRGTGWSVRTRILIYKKDRSDSRS